MPTDYDLPTWFFDEDTSDADRDAWLTQERCRRQAQRQRTGYARRMEQKAERDARKRKASPAHVKLEDYR